MNRLILMYLAFNILGIALTTVTATSLPPASTAQNKITSSNSNIDITGVVQQVSTVRILRFRTPKTGSIVSIKVNEEDFRNTPLHGLVEGVLAHGSSSSSAATSNDDDHYDCTWGTVKLDTSQPPFHLGLKHGTLLTITQKTSKVDLNDNAVSSNNNNYIIRNKHRQKRREQPVSDDTVTSFDPFPHLARPRFSDKRRAIRARANRRGGMSYSDLDQLSASIHKVEIQSDPIISRIYMCSKSAESFLASTSSSNTKKKKKKKQLQQQQQQQHKCALLFGTVSKERVKQNKLDGTTTTTTTALDKDKFCEVAKVHALWEPPQNKLLSCSYDATELLSLELSTAVQRALQVAKRLQLQPVGWIYTHNNKDDDDESSTTKKEVPVSARDVVIAAKIQTALMKTLGRETGGRFVTVSLDLATGESEAFQMSDQCIQMVAEGVLLLEDPPADDTANSNTLIKTSAPVIVDGKETHTVDSLLFLVNTGMLSHTGSLSGDGVIVGKLTSKVKEQLRTCLAKHEDGSKTIQFLSNFNLLLVLSKVLNEADFSELCDLISISKRRAKVVLSKHLQLTLESIASA